MYTSSAVIDIRNYNGTSKHNWVLFCARHARMQGIRKSWRMSLIEFWGIFFCHFRPNLIIAKQEINGKTRTSERKWMRCLVICKWGSWAVAFCLLALSEREFFRIIKDTNCQQLFSSAGKLEACYWSCLVSDQPINRSIRTIDPVNLMNNSDFYKSQISGDFLLFTFLLYLQTARVRSCVSVGTL